MYDSLELTRRMHAEALDWYKTAEKKAEIVLGLIGTFIVFASGIILVKPEDMRMIVSQFNPFVWTGLALTFSAMLFALFSAYQCVKSRLSRDGGDIKQKSEIFYPVEEMYFFQHHASHVVDRLSISLNQVNKEDEIAIYACQIINLSKNVVEKHKWINRGLKAILISILLLLATTVTYMINLK